MTLHRRAFVLGGHITPFIGKKHPDFVWERHPDHGKRTNPVLEDYITTAVLARWTRPALRPSWSTAPGSGISSASCSAARATSARLSWAPTRACCTSR
jgi:hypothetical protein